MGDKKVCFLDRKKDIETIMLNDKDRHADALRNYIISNSIDISNIQDKMGYTLSIELINKGIMTFQFENYFAVCFLPKEISEEQYLSYRKIRRELKRKELCIINNDSNYGLQEERYNRGYDKNGINRLDDIMDNKDFVTILESDDCKGRRL